MQCRAVWGAVDEEADTLKCCVNADSASFVTWLKHTGKEVPLALNVALATSIKCHHWGRELPQLGTVLLVSEKKKLNREGFPGGSAGTESACNVGDLGSIPWSGRYPGEGTVSISGKVNLPRGRADYPQRLLNISNTVQLETLKLGGILHVSFCLTPFLCKGPIIEAVKGRPSSFFIKAVSQLVLPKCFLF